MNYLHYEFNLKPTDLVVVELDKQANVLLLDGLNYQNYKTGKNYHYYGGLAKVSPIKLSPPRIGHWHLVVDLGGYAGQVHVGVKLETVS
jgi:hypothetical protein